MHVCGESCPTLAAPWIAACQTPGLWNFSGKNTEWGAISTPGDLPDSGD